MSLRLDHETAARRTYKLRGEQAKARVPQRVKPISIECPECKAPVGTPCHTQQGTLSGHHASRARMATRLFNAEGHHITGREPVIIWKGHTVHILVDGKTLCGVGYNARMAFIQGRIRPGVTREVGCTGCVTLFEEGLRCVGAT